MTLSNSPISARGQTSQFADDNPGLKDASDPRDDDEAEPSLSPVAGAGPTDPFADADVGTEVWNRIRPTGTKYWALVLGLAVGLSVFSYYWRNHMVPAQPLVWNAASEVQLRQALNSDHPVLVWYTPASSSVRPGANRQVSSSSDSDNHELATATQESKKLAEAIAQLDNGSVRRTLRLLSAELWRVEFSPNPELGELLFQDTELPDEGLLLLSVKPPRRTFLNAEQISSESVLNWLETAR
ncbi:MAG: hypothetical protein JNL67_16940 [Planctomycetaceae bacterium]|nr:hypothetical protein [Planctomycetaceae bacterium]